MKREWNPFGIAQWIAWLGATGFACAGLATFFYREFETAGHARETTAARQSAEARIEGRLERIEEKVDRLTDLMRGR